MIDPSLPALDLPVPDAMPSPVNADPVSDPAIGFPPEMALEPVPGHDPVPVPAPAPLPAPAQPAHQMPASHDMGAPAGAEALVAQVSRPISEVMEQILWTVHAEDSIERVEQILAEQGLSSAPVVGSNGAIVGMIGQSELAQFHIEGKNAKAVQAWEISRIKSFEVSPGDSVEDVAKLMAENKIENISVTECGRLKGIVSTQDLLQDILKVLPDEHQG